MSDLWLSNPANAAFLEDRTKRPKSGSSCVALFIALILFGIAIPFGVVGISELITRTQLQQSGERIGATITNLVEDDSGDSTDYEVTYGYRVGERPFTRTEEVAFRFYVRLKVNQRLDIVYLPSNPAVSRIDSDTGKADTPLLLGFGALFTVIGIGILFAMAQHGDRVDKLVKNGQLLYGEVTSFEGEIDSDNDLMARLAYKFTRPDGTVFHHKDRFRTSHNDWKDRRPKTGNQIAVLYLDDRNYLLL